MGDETRWPKDPRAPARMAPGSLETHVSASCSACGHKGDVWIETTPLFVQAVNEMVSEGRSEAMAERTREVEALLRQVANDQARAGCSDEAFRALRIGITAIRASWPDAFPKPGSTT